MSNRLSAETSPYLLQHADNPVDWHPWCEEALALARDQDKPILLSIGYSACHWCHVMAHESFEDAETAAAMNECFVNIKVDREERPDLDQIYQSAHALMLRRNGGWPLTMFLTPDQVPFYGGTYFPPVPRYNLPGFRDLVRQVAAAYHEHRDEIVRQGEPLRAALAQAGTQRNVVMADAEVIAEGVAQLVQAFDAEHGGFGGAPKFPNEADWVLLMRQAAAGEAGARAMIERTLNGMAKGGLYDHLGGGFCRYSVDAQWEIPHFEKMLYTNAQLLCLYADGWLLVGEPRWQEVVTETIAWMQREMRAPEGGFHSALDADSEGEEGKFYVWSREEARALLDEPEYALAAAFYGLARAPNFEHAWHLHVEESLAAVAQGLGMGMEEASARLAALRAKLLAARDTRVRPGLDDKLLTSWNALAIKGLARAGRVFDEAGWIGQAQQAADFLRATMWQDGRLLATCKEGRAHLNAYLDDHAFLLDAMLELLQAHFRRQDLEFAIALADALLARFEDPAGGFYFTSHDHEPLIHRPKPAHDGAMPAGNGIAAFALQRLGHMLGETRYLKAAESTLVAFSADMRASPAATPSLLVALEEWLEPPMTVVLRGEAQALSQWKRMLDAMLLPRCLVVAIPQGVVTGFPTLDKKGSDCVNAHVCRGVECLPAINKQDELVSLILR